MRILSLAFIVGCGHVRTARCVMIIDRIVLLSHLRDSNSNIMNLNVDSGSDPAAELDRWTKAEIGLKSQELKVRQKSKALGCLGSGTPRR